MDLGISLSTITFLASPGRRRDVFESDADVFADHAAAVRTATVFEHRFAGVAKAGALTATTFQRPAPIY